MRKIGLLLVVLTIFFFSKSSEANILLDRVVAVVNQEVVTWSELYKSMETDAAPQLRELKDDEKRKIFKENEVTFLENLINLKLQLQEARGLGIGASEEELKEGVENIKKKYGMTESDFVESLKKEGFTLEEYKKKLREQIVISKIVNVQIRSKILVSEGDIQRYIDENKEMTESGEGYKISQIFLKKPKSETDGMKVEEKAAEILKKVKDGGNFADLAKQYSEDPSASSGGDLGLIRKGQMLKEFSVAVSKMKPGEVSAPFWSERGLHIIRLDSKTEAKGPNEIKDEVRTALINKSFGEKYSAWIKALREKAFIEIRL